MQDHFGALGNKVLKGQVYLKAITYVNTEETSLWNEQKKLWNIKYFSKTNKIFGKTCRVLEYVWPV